MLGPVLRHTVLLWGLQVLCGTLAQLLYGLTVPAALVTVLYAVLAGWVALEMARAHQSQPWHRRAAGALLTASLWQLPALAGSMGWVGEAMGWAVYGATSDLLDFAMQSWSTVLMPLLAVLPVGRDPVFGLAWYYHGLVWGGPVLVLSFVVTAAWPRRSAQPVAEAHRPAAEAAAGRVARPTAQQAAAAMGGPGWQPVRRAADVLRQRAGKPRRPR